MVGVKRRQEEERGMMKTPKISTLKVPMVSPESAGRTVWSNSLSQPGLPGSWDRIETSRKLVEQERPNGNRKEPGSLGRETIEGRYRQSPLGVGSARSSDETWKAPWGRHSGAKGLTGQGTRGSER